MPAGGLKIRARNHFGVLSNFRGILQHPIGHELNRFRQRGKCGRAEQRQASGYLEKKIAGFHKGFPMIIFVIFRCELFKRNFLSAEPGKQSHNEFREMKKILALHFQSWIFDVLSRKMFFEDRFGRI
jgi:hypothetical protein